MNGSLREQFVDEGYCYVENVVPASELRAIRECVERDVVANSLLPPPTGYVPSFLRFNQALAPYVAAEPIFPLIESLLGPKLRISMFTGTVNGPGIPRGDLHADWPYNQAGAARIPAPYPDCLMHIVTMWMLSDFTAAGGGTIIVPRSHKQSDHPRKDGPIKPAVPFPGEKQLASPAGTVAVLDARLWHAVAPNETNQPRVAVIVRYAPWWLNIRPLRPGTADRRDIVDAQNGTDSKVPALPESVFEKLPGAVQKLVSHAVEKDAT